MSTGSELVGKNEVDSEIWDSSEALISWILSKTTGSTLSLTTLTGKDVVAALRDAEHHQRCCWIASKIAAFFEVVE
jgi:hypothetical protein